MLARARMPRDNRANWEKHSAAIWVGVDPWRTVRSSPVEASVRPSPEKVTVPTFDRSGERRVLVRLTPVPHAHRPVAPGGRWRPLGRTPHARRRPGAHGAGSLVGCAAGAAPHPHRPVVAGAGETAPANATPVIQVVGADAECFHCRKGKAPGAVHAFVGEDDRSPQRAPRGSSVAGRLRGARPPRRHRWPWHRCHQPAPPWSSTRTTRPAKLSEAMVRVAHQEAVRHDRLDEVIESTVLVGDVRAARRVRLLDRRVSGGRAVVVRAGHARDPLIARSRSTALMGCALLLWPYRATAYRLTLT
jgi:hypothetical protein